MNNDKLIELLKSKYVKLYELDSFVELKSECRSLFDDVCISDHSDKIIEFVNKIKKDIQLTSSDISDKFEDQRFLIKTMYAQIGFFLSFYSFLVSKLSFVIDESTKDEISSWSVDILSNLNLCLGNAEWKVFMSNFIMNYHPHLKSVLLEIYECLGLDIPTEIEPANYYDNEKIFENICYDVPTVKKRKKKVNEKLSLEESLEIVKKSERNNYRPELNLDRPDVKEKLKRIQAMTPVNKPPRSKSSVPRLESSRHKSGEKKKEDKGSASKKTRKRKSLVPETPRDKPMPINRPHRVTMAALKKLNGKPQIIKTESPIPDRSKISTPTTLARLRRAEDISRKMVEERRGSNNSADLWIRQRSEEEHSLTNFSTDSFDLKRANSLSSCDNPTRRVTRIRSGIFNSFMSPIKGTTIESATIFSPTKVNGTKPQSLLSPRKTPKKHTSPKPLTRPPFMSPKKSVQNTSLLFSPSKRMTSTVILSSATPATETKPRTPLKSCLKSPAKRRRTLLDKTDKGTDIKRRKTVVGKEIAPSVLLSPKVKQRTFNVNTPSQDYCEDTMYMDTNEFIRTSGSKAAPKLDYTLNNNASPTPAYFADSSLSSFDGFQSERVKAVSMRRLSVQRKLFDSTPGGISSENILSTSRRSTAIPTPNFFNVEPETDESNGFKFP